MAKMTREQTLVRVFFGESERWNAQPLSHALLERLRHEGFAGATVFRGIAGFGARRIHHTTHILELSEDIPVVVEIVDGPEMIAKLEPILDEMIADGLVTMEKVKVLRYGR
jgi:PII-like signaling protein